MSLAIARKVLVLRALGLIAITKKDFAPFVTTALFRSIKYDYEKLARKY